MVKQLVPRSRSQAGFTVMETMVTLSIAAILAGIAVPSMRDLTRSVSITTEVNGLVAAINLARSEAAKRGTRVALCRTDDPLAATPECGGTTRTWTTGWLVYAVSNGRADPEFDTAQSDVLVAVGKPSGSGITVMANTTVDLTFEFNSDGSTNESNQTSVFAFCDTRGANYGKQISILPVGRPSVAVAAACTPS